MLSKVQVKTTRYKSEYGVYAVNLRNTGGSSGTVNSRVSESTNIDYLFCLTEEGTKYLIPFIELENNHNSINLGSKQEKNKVS